MSKKIIITNYDIKKYQHQNVYSAGPDRHFKHPCIAYIKSGHAQFLYKGKTVYAYEGDLVYIAQGTKYTSIWYGSPDIEWNTIVFNFKSQYDFYEYYFLQAEIQKKPWPDSSAKGIAANGCFRPLSVPSVLRGQYDHGSLHSLREQNLLHTSYGIHFLCHVCNGRLRQCGEPDRWCGWTFQFRYRSRYGILYCSGDPERGVCHCPSACQPGGRPDRLSVL